MNLRFLRRTTFRMLAYLATRPRPPEYSNGFAGPVVVVGSAPVATRPIGLDASYTMISVNGSQHNAAKWGVERPHITFIAANRVDGGKTNAVNVRKVLNDAGTGTLYVLLWDGSRERLIAGLERMRYGYDALHVVSRSQRIALHRRVVGRFNFEARVRDRFSNGITAVLFAIHNGARTVIVSGIDPYADGHAYSDNDLVRQHVATDAAIIGKLMADGHRIFTADAKVSERTGLPLWTDAEKAKTAEA